MKIHLKQDERKRTRFYYFLLGIPVGILISISISYLLYAQFTQSAQAAAIKIVTFAPVINVRSVDDITSTRQKLVMFIFSESSLPAGHPEVEPDIPPPFRPSGLTRADRLTIRMDYGLTSIAYLYHPKTPNGRLIIYHQGHEHETDVSRDVVEHFLNLGYRVMTYYMPLFGENSRPIMEIPRVGEVHIVTHLMMTFLDHPLRYFFEPVVVGLNYMEENYSPSLIAMTGLSGGGWTTTLYAAIDPRITHSYPVAGSLPLSLRETRDTGDWEQIYPALYQIANYYDLYAMGASNGSQVQILNKYDPCCFSLSDQPAYAELVNTTAALSSGRFSVYIDDSHRQHTTSPAALQVIESDLALP